MCVFDCVFICVSVFVYLCVYVCLFIHPMQWSDDMHSFKLLNVYHIYIMLASISFYNVHPTSYIQLNKPNLCLQLPIEKSES